MQVAVENNWNRILERKEAKIIKNNEIENAKRIDYECRIGELIKIIHEKNSRMRPTKLSPPNEGPYPIVIVHDDATVTIQRGGDREKLSLTRIAPYFNK